MRELKIFFVVAVFTALVYWGVEPYAHSVMNPHVAPANFDFAKEDIDFAKSTLAAKQEELTLANDELKKAKNSKDKELKIQAENKQKATEAAVESAKATLAANQALWDRVKEIDFKAGNAQSGAEFFATNCVACHSLKTAGLEGAIPDSSIYGVLPPDLSSTGALYDEKFLAALILNPALALKVEHKFGEAFIMTAYNDETSGEDASVAKQVVSANIANVIAYLKEVSKDYKKAFESEVKEELKAKYAKMQDLSQSDKAKFMEKDLAFAKAKNDFIEACGRCHDMKYDGFKALSAMSDLNGYLGMNPPDLSMMIRARSGEYLNNFINNTQKVLTGTAMPRVGLTQNAQTSVISYMEMVGDSKKDERTSVGIGVMIFFAILSVFAILWKRKVWSELH